MRRLLTAPLARGLLAAFSTQASRRTVHIPAIQPQAHYMSSYTTWLAWPEWLNFERTNGSEAISSQWNITCAELLTNVVPEVKSCNICIP